MNNYREIESIVGKFIINILTNSAIHFLFGIIISILIKTNVFDIIHFYLIMFLSLLINIYILCKMLSSINNMMDLFIINFAIVILSLCSGITLTFVFGYLFLNIFDCIFMVIRILPT